MIKKILLALVATLIVVVAVVLVKTTTFESVQKDYPTVDKIEFPNRVAERLAEAVRIKTISYDDTSMIDYSQFDSLHNFLDKEYPLVDSLLEKVTINKHSLLYIWKGKNDKLAPAIFIGHQDVVPAEKESLHEWKQPPFAGNIVDGEIWGRGTLDDKGAILGLFEATSHLLKQGFEPERTIMFGFGHDEEVDGLQGAGQIAAYLASKNIMAEFVMDEGLVITEGVVPGIKKPVALVGTSEKGYLTLELSVQLDGGHSSMPGNETPIDVLGKAIATLKATPFPNELNAALSAFSETVGPEMPFGLKVAFANRWLLEGAIIGAYSESAPGRALITTTIAPTVFHSGEKENAIPSIAKAAVNFRILPGTTIDDVVRHVEKAIGDKRIKIQKLGNPEEATPVSSHMSFGYRVIEKSVRELEPKTVVAPNLMVATADAKHYTGVAKDVYRFLPVHMNGADIGRIHGNNEYISIENYEQSIRFYIQMLKNSAQKSL